MASTHLLRSLSGSNDVPNEIISSTPRRWVEGFSVIITRLMPLVIKYTLFAILATVANILCQDAVNRIYHGPYDLYPSMFLGTLVGLVVKYVLDKKYIFFFQSKNLFQDGQKFFLYASMGVITTFIFWAVEIVFDYSFKTVPMRYTGAVIGLGIGYWMKYQLDKRFVFKQFG